MLISKEVEVRWHRKTKKWYVSMGYTFTNYGDAFKVKIEHLSKGNTCQIILKCDYCGCIFNREYRAYRKYREREITSKDSCCECKTVKSIESNKSKFKKETTIYIINNIKYTPLKEIDIDDKNKCGIYQIVNIINGKRYIGSAIDLNGRMINHISKLNKNKHHSPYLQNSWNKYNKQSFRFEIIEYIDDNSDLKNKIIEREQYWMDKYQSYNIKYGYNVAKKAYSPLGFKRGEMPQEVKNKISKANRGKKRKDVLGENNHNTKMTNKDVEDLKIKFKNGTKVKELAKIYSIDISVVYDIINFKTWKHILPNLDLTQYKRKQKNTQNS